jgi:DnaJ like chaperone protein
MIAIWIIAPILILLLWLIFRRRNQTDTSQPVNGEMPVQWRYTDKSVMMVYIYLATWLMRKDPRESNGKREFISTYFKQYFKDNHFNTDTEIQNALKHSVHIRSVTNWVNKRMNNGHERKQLIDFLIDLSFVDGDLTQMEYVALARLGELTGVRLSYLEAEVLRRKKAFNSAFTFDSTMDLLANRTEQRRKALLCLELQDPVTEELIKKAYRKLAKQYHPDKLEHLTHTEQKEAGIRFIAIQEAYEWLLNEL